MAADQHPDESLFSAHPRRNSNLPTLSLSLSYATPPSPVTMKSSKCTGNGAMVSTSMALPFFRLLLVFLLMCSAVSGDTFLEDKKSDQNRPFYMGSRYGRSGQVSGKVQVTPRTDRFFMGSRYGKRASTLEIDDIVPPYFGSAPGDLQDGELPKIGPESAKIGDSNILGYLQDALHQHQTKLMKCIYVGMGNLYKCRDFDQMM